MPDPQRVVTCIGETMVAFAPHGQDGLEQARSFDVAIAGAESNVAVYLQDLGTQARWISRLGDDPFGRLVQHAIARAGVDVSGVVFDPARQTGIMFKDPSPAGTTVRYYRRESAASAMSPEMIDAVRGINSLLLHITGITPALSDSCGALIEQLLGDQRRPDCPISFDVNLRPALWHGEESELLARLANQANIVFVGLDEADALWKCVDSDDVRRILPTPHVVVVKDGARGATAFVGETRHDVPALKVRVVEPVGAGDAFAAGFLSAWLAGDAPRRCLRLGHLTAASALVVSSDHGPLIDAHTVERFLNSDEEEWAAAQVDAVTAG